MTDLPNIRIKSLVSFPSNALGGTGIAIDKTSGHFTVNLNYSEFGVSESMPPGNSLLVWNPTANLYTLIPASFATGVLEAPNDGVTYGRKGLTWVNAWADSALTGNATAPNPPAGDNDSSIATTAFVMASAARPNVVINGDFRVNQGGYVSAAVLATGAYGHDQWKAGAGGGDYSFTQLLTGTQITIASGKSLIQPIEDTRVVGGSYILTWTGTAQARVGVNTLTPSGVFAASPLLIGAQTANTVMSIEFNTGTLGKVKLESGAIATPFVVPDYATELAACQRYFEIIQMIVGTTAAGTFSNQAQWKVTKRASPVLSQSFSTGTGATFAVIGAGLGGISQVAAHTALATATVTGNIRL